MNRTNMIEVVALIVAVALVALAIAWRAHFHRTVIPVAPSTLLDHEEGKQSPVVDDDRMGEGLEALARSTTAPPDVNRALEGDTGRVTGSILRAVEDAVRQPIRAVRLRTKTGTLTLKTPSEQS